MEVIDLNPEGIPTRSAAFLIMYSTDSMPWQDYPLEQDEQRDIVIPQVLVVGRSDGLLGFVGGMVDQQARGDDINVERVEDALAREALEEIDYLLVDDPEPLVRVKGPRLDKYVYCLELPHEELALATINAHQAEHYGSEITGTLLLQIADYEAITGKSYGGLQNVLRLPFAASARQELAQLIVRKELMAADNFELVCTKAGYEVSQLLGGFSSNENHQS